MPFEKFSSEKGADFQCEKVSMSCYGGPKFMGVPLVNCSRRAEAIGATFGGEEGGETQEYKIRGC